MNCTYTTRSIGGIQNQSHHVDDLEHFIEPARLRRLNDIANDAMSDVVVAIARERAHMSRLILKERLEHVPASSCHNGWSW